MRRIMRLKGMNSHLYLILDSAQHLFRPPALR